MVVKNCVAQLYIVFISMVGGACTVLKEGSGLYKADVIPHWKLHLSLALSVHVLYLLFCLVSITGRNSMFPLDFCQEPSLLPHKNGISQMSQNQARDWYWIWGLNYLRQGLKFATQDFGGPVWKNNYEDSSLPSKWSLLAVHFKHSLFKVFLIKFLKDWTVNHTSTKDEAILRNGLKGRFP